jgi:hypothetical protein
MRCGRCTDWVRTATALTALACACAWCVAEPAELAKQIRLARRAGVDAVTLMRAEKKLRRAEQRAAAEEARKAAEAEEALANEKARMAVRARLEAEAEAARLAAEAGAVAVARRTAEAEAAEAVERARIEAEEAAMAEERLQQRATELAARKELDAALPWFFWQAGACACRRRIGAAVASHASHCTLRRRTLCMSDGAARIAVARELSLTRCAAAAVSLLVHHAQTLWISRGWRARWRLHALRA